VERIDPDTRIGAVRLRVADLDRVADFYERAIGLAALDRTAEMVRLGAGEDGSVVELVAAPDAPSRPRGTTGLFHQAILVPSRADLARSLRRVVAAGGRISGASDHLVSEALYLGDPDGNGIEIYRDRPREEWPTSNGQLEMATLPLDLEGVLGELDGDPEPGPVPATSTSETWTPRRRSIRGYWVSTSRCGDIRARFSFRRGAITTTSGSIPGSGRERPRRLQARSASSASRWCSPTPRPSERSSDASTRPASRPERTAKASTSPTRPATR
jgi:catechol 2,3-dioxygenase-like lactoylglutathione lyase family enzyme